MEPMRVNPIYGVSWSQWESTSYVGSHGTNESEPHNLMWMEPMRINPICGLSWNQPEWTQYVGSMQLFSHLINIFIIYALLYRGSYYRVRFAILFLSISSFYNIMKHQKFGDSKMVIDGINRRTEVSSSNLVPIINKI